MNISQLQPHPPPQARSISKDGPEKDAEFLAFRLLNRRARVRLSPDPHDLRPLPGKAHLLAVANSKGWFAAVARRSSSGFHLISSPLADLQSAFSSTTPNDDNQIPFSARRTLFLPSIPNLLVLALNDTRLLIGLVEGSILVFDTARLFTEGTDEIQPLSQFPSTTDTAPRQIVANPGDMPELVAVLREPGGSPDSQMVEILDVQKLHSIGGWQSGGTPDSFPTALSWSPKGKQLAIGLRSGEIVTFSPTATGAPKSIIPKPTSAPNPSVSGATWLSNPTFHATYTPPGLLATDSEQTHYIVSWDPKTNTASDIRLNSPCYPFPGNRPPSSFEIVLRNWNPYKFLLIMGDSSSSDIGVVGCLADPFNPSQEIWANLSLEETATPSMPLDKDMEDTVLVGLELDLTNTKSFQTTRVSGEAFDVPPPPIVYAYANDGTVQAWFVVNSEGQSYPGMVGSTAQISGDVSAPAMVRADSAMDTMQSSTPSAPNSGQTPKPQSIFGQPSSFGTQPQPFGTQASAFGQRPSQPSSSSQSFNKPSSPFGSPPAFGSGTPQFGQTGFGMGTLSSPSGPAPQRTPAVVEESMASDANNAFGGMSLGGTSSTGAKPSVFGTSAMFGQPAPSNNQGSSSASAFGSGSGSGAFGALKISPGFGAFANFGQQQTPSASPPSEPSKASPAFGSSGFASRPASAFGQSGFGQPSVFGKSSFGTAPVPAPAPTTTTSPGSSSGGFGAFAQAGPTSFTAALQQQQGTQSSGVFGARKTDSAPSKSVFGDGGSLAKNVSVFGQSGPPIQDNNMSQDTASSPATAVERPATEPVMPSPSPASTTTPKTLSPPPSPIRSAPSTTNAGSPSQSQSSSSSYFKPGFGAFADSSKSSSPFLQPPKSIGGYAALSKPTSDTASSSSTPRIISPTQPRYNMQSPVVTKLDWGKPMFGQSSFGSPVTPVATPKAAPITSIASPSSGGFASFSTGASGFSAFAGASKSFGSLLREGGDSERSIQPASPTHDGPSKQDSKAPILSSRSPARKAPGPSTELLQPRVIGPSGSSSDEAPNSDDEDDLPSRPERFSEEELTGQEPSTLSDVSKEPSLGSISLSGTSQTSSFVDVTHPSEQRPSESPAVAEEDDRGHQSADQGDDDTDSFLSESSTESEEEVPTSNVYDESNNPTYEDLVSNRSPSTTPKAKPYVYRPWPPPSTLQPAQEDTPKISPLLTPSSSTPEGSPVKDTPSAPSPLPTPSNSTPEGSSVKDIPSTPSPLPTSSSSTPEGSLVKDIPSTPSPQPALVAPLPVTPSAHAAPFSLGLGKPSTRPVRSSPLASAPVTSPDDEEVNEALQSTPAVSKAKPASPKNPFGQLPPKSISTEETASAASRPKTPPLLSLFGGPSPKQTELPPFSLPQLSPTPGPINFSSAPTLTSTPSDTPGGLFGPKSTAPVLSSSGLFGSKPMPPVTLGSPVSPSPPPKAPTPVPKEPTVEEGMQAECAYLFVSLAKELEDLRALAQEASKRTAELNKSTGPRTSNMTSSDIAQFKLTLKRLGKEIVELKNRRGSYSQSLRELESNLLKATTKKEEIVRFSRANTDPEFAKALKVRTLGPEYAETQNQLRRHIRALRDRILKLEDHVKLSKKKVNELKTGKPSFRPPSLDTINRTYRNIDTALDQQASDISELTSRVARLELEQNTSRIPTRDKRLHTEPSRSKSRPRDVTPNVAVTTAAALNAERSAQRLKRALLSVRQEPLLNTQAVDALAVPGLFETPKKAGGSAFSPDLSRTPDSTGMESLLPKPEAISDPFLLPPLEDDSPLTLMPSYTPGPRSRGLGGKYHMKSVALKKSPSPSPAKEPAAAGAAKAPVVFDWGPIPSIQAKSSLSTDVRVDKQKVNPIDGSWVLDGFQSK